MKRDKDGRVKDSWLSKFRSWRLKRKMQKGEIPHGRTAEMPGRNEIELKKLRENRTKIVQMKNAGLSDAAILEHFDCHKMGNLQAVIRQLKNEGRLPRA